ncbi:hypothetical protein Q428_11385 [Fervidicella metallireducens AeB]|uniref:Uncharacterized protein n=1 Tax=Fervidicella metallireducens AeB TaxID=1403537 RepID=A0A017RTL9_9CLOT|nr:hypothetical protein [Fervidicella metallireducens]EYE87809.1 hypothetical protein Q428_11385 [Fervidicella metallireducens AeB]
MVLGTNEYEKCLEKYELSSLSIYLGLRHAHYELVDDGFIMGMFSKKKRKINCLRY